MVSVKEKGILVYIISHCERVEEKVVGKSFDQFQVDEDLQDIIGYISQLEELDTDNIEPTYQVFEMENVWRADEILPQDATREELLALTKEEKDNQIKVPKVL